MSLVSDPQIESAYEDVRNDKSDTNWLLLTYAADKRDVLEVKATGTGGLSEFVDNLEPDQAAFGYLRMVISNDELSQRVKFVFVSWCGPAVKVMRKAKLSVHVSGVRQVLRSYAIEISASDLHDLEEKEVTLLLRKASGANYDRQKSDY
ncbi:actin depolymerizing protein [Basidiobolus meristosporus CBS 931.73]|uniref:Actin depolymerizing protein n=1 Tax=Basidiobolus meristosporus CBS 931.73 TaxID=1314790 RepID=A0A1Y1Y2B0_9FUNG|nr:actin depolymerizing protein [Basidiobolus meristosporus CBS 931.73]|eukprot:ORX92109.1 actin depolymerizing protein [Basidiobolus meristosporus CBS 931.73]